MQPLILARYSNVNTNEVYPIPRFSISFDDAEYVPVTKFFLGLDGGQSTTTAVIGDEAGRIIGVGHAGPCNHVSTEESRDRFTQAISGAVNQAAAAAGISEPGYAAACLGLSGGPADKDSLARELVSAGCYLITHDAAIALAGALAGEPGIIAIAGTGSIAYGKNARGETARAGGWGYIFGDEGGAFDLVRQALRAALRYEEGWGPPTRLRDVLLQETAEPDLNTLLHRFYTPEYPRERIASYAKLVSVAAEDGDAAAQDILRSGAQALATLAAAVKHLLFPQGASARVSLAGGVFDSAILQERFRLLVELDGVSSVQSPVFGPAAGALLEAYRIGGMHVTLKDAPSGV